MPPADRLRELESLYLHGTFERLQRLAEDPRRVPLDLMQVLIIAARELRALRELVLQGQGGPDRSGGEGGR